MWERDSTEHHCEHVNIQVVCVIEAFVSKSKCVNGVSIVSLRNMTDAVIPVCFQLATVNLRLELY